MNTMFPEFLNLENMKDEAPTLDDDSSCFSVDRNNPAKDSMATGSDFVSDFNKREAEYRSKEDQDVAVFLSLVDKMSVKSLLFILQGHARSMHNIHQHDLQTTLSQINSERRALKTSPKSIKKTKMIKHCRFAEVFNGVVREEVFEIPHVADFSDEDIATMWWSHRQMKLMKKEAAKVVRFFHKHRPEYLESVQVLANASHPDSDDVLVDYHVKKLSSNSFPRGLECHIVSDLSVFRDDGVQSVILQQEKFRANQARNRFFDAEEKNGNSHDDMWEAIRAAYVPASEPCKLFALLMAEADHIEALKSSISRWDA